MKYSSAFPGNKFDNCSCEKCGANLGNRDWEKARVVVAKDENGKWKTFCYLCAGWSGKNKIGSGWTMSGPKEFNI